MPRVPIPHYFQPGGYHFVDRSSGNPVRIEGDSYDDVAAKVLKFRLAHGHPPGNPIDELYEYACNSAPFICRDTSPAAVVSRVTSNPTASLAVRVAEWFASFYKSGGAADRGTTQGETERRANICADCPHNQHLTGCGACVDGIARLFFVWRRDRGIPHEKQLAQSGCTAIGHHSGVAVLAKELPPVPENLKASLPPRCWRR